MGPTTPLSFPGLRGPSDYEDSGYASDEAVANDPIIYRATVSLSFTEEPVRARKVSFGTTEICYFAESEAPSPTVADSPIQAGLPPRSEVPPPRVVTRRVNRKTRQGSLPTPPRSTFDPFYPASMFYSTEEVIKMAQDSARGKPKANADLGPRTSDWGQEWPCDTFFRQWAS